MWAQFIRTLIAVIVAVSIAMALVALLLPVTHAFPPWPGTG